MASTEAHQLLKLPVVFEHFFEHQQEDNNIGFLEFLDIHYLHGSPQDSDYDRDMQLPFKTTADCVSVLASASITNHLLISIDLPVFYVKTQKLELEHQQPLSSFLANIWQPPRLC